MTITPVSAATTPPVTTPSTSLYTQNSAATEAKKTFDQETFLTLLVAQLRNQDPSSPMDTNAMMAQSTQLASMEQLTGLADTSRESFALQMRIAASGMVGQQVSFKDADGVKQTGIVSGVNFDLSVPMLTVGKFKVPLDSVSEVKTATATSTPATTSTTSTDATTSSTATDGSTAPTSPGSVAVAPATVI